MQEVTAQVQVGVLKSPIRIDAWLNKKYPRIPRTQWKERIQVGKVSVSKKRIKPSTLLKGYEIIQFEFKRKNEPKINLDYKVLYEDDELLIIDKPPNLPVHPSGVYFENTLTSLLKNDFGRTFHLAHRLDRETSGVLLATKTVSALHNIIDQFKKNSVQKIYLTLIEGKFLAPLSAKGWLAPDLNSKVLKKRSFYTQKPSLNEWKKESKTKLALEKRENPVFKPCQTEFIKAEHGTEISLVTVKLITGRTHQIRATLCSLGYPIVGDKLYGIDDTAYLRFINDQLSINDYKNLRIGRSALHCHSMKLIHPTLNRSIKFTSKLPNDMMSQCIGMDTEKVLKQL